MPKLLMSANTDWYLYNFRFSLARFCRQQGYEVVFVSPLGRYVDHLKNDNFRWLEWNLGRQTINPLSEFGSLRQLFNIYRQEKPDLVHHHTIKPVLYGSLIARWTGKPGIVNSITGRGYVFSGEDLRARLLRLCIDPLYRVVFKSSDCMVIFENETDQQYFIRRGLVPAERTCLIQGVGVDPELFSPKPEPDGVPVILMASRMLWDKGVGVLVEAARILKSRVKARIVLVGEPDQGNPGTVDQTILAEWHKEGAIEWWGWQDDMPAIYARSHIVTLPTMYAEGVPTNLLEAAACGRPLVASDTPGCRDVILDGQNGYLIPPNDPRALAEALENLVRDPVLRKDMGNASRQLVLQKFTHTRINPLTLSVYQESLNQTDEGD